MMRSMLPDRDSEIDLFKRHINLSEFAASQGYGIDRKESARSSIVMRGPRDDKLVITMNQANGHWIFFSVRDEDDNGTIIDFAQRRLRCDLGALRKILRPWIGKSPHPPTRPSKNDYAEAVIPVSKDVARCIAEFSAMQPMNGHHAYLVDKRSIPNGVLSDSRFADKMRVDAFNNAVFPHYNRSGLCGYELKNQEFTGFSRGGQKGLWTSKPFPDDNRLVIVESAIDALSYHALHRPKRARYISIGGSMNSEQPKLIQSAIGRLPTQAQLIIATDNDIGGDELVTQIQHCAESSGRPDVSITEHRPEIRGDDWNDVLRAEAPLP